MLNDYAILLYNAYVDINKVAKKSFVWNSVLVLW